MTLLDREYLSDFFRVLFTLLAFLAILLFAKVFLEFFQEAAEGAELHWGLLFYFCRLPRFFVDTAVVLAAASILWNVARRTRTNELLACLAGGISPVRLAVPFFAGAAIVSLVCLGLTEFVLGGADRAAYYIEQRHIKNKPIERITRNRDILLKWGTERVYVIDSYAPASNEMQYPAIVDMWPGTEVPRQVIHAASATLDERSSLWTFHDATIRGFDQQGRIEHFERQAELHGADIEPPITPRLAEFLDGLDNPDQMNLRELVAYIKLLDAQGKRTSEYRLMMHRKVALPLAAAAVALMICAHMLRPKAYGVLLDLGGGLLLIGLYYGVYFLSWKLGQVEFGLTPALSAWLPNILFAVVGVGMFLRGGIR
ncbi:MAG: LptF/LptG family permease [Candidatus Sumerlaeia bacterium]|nr:LptF/LptG family permease [Candidatus Sumerlaeia bacterium]